MSTPTISQILAQAAQDGAAVVTTQTAFDANPVLSQVQGLGFDDIANLVAVMSEQSRYESGAANSESKSAEIVSLTDEIIAQLHRLDSLLRTAQAAF